MKDFFQLREEAEFLSESKLTGSLNKLQNLWNEHAEHNMKIGVMPMFSRPWDRLTKGGVLVVGINPANTKWTAEQRMKIYEKNPGAQVPVWDKENRKYRSQDVGRSPLIKGSHSEVQMRYSQLSSEWEARGGSKNKYISGMRGFFEKLESADLYDEEAAQKSTKKRSSKLMMANYIPFASKDEKALKKMKNLPEIEKFSRIWLQNFIDVSKPEVIIMFGNKPWDNTGLVAKTVPSKNINAISSLGKTTNKNGKGLGQILKVGFTEGGIPILGFMHPSGSQTGGINTKNYTQPHRLRMIKKVFDEYVEK